MHGLVNRVYQTDKLAVGKLKINKKKQESTRHIYVKLSVYYRQIRKSLIVQKQ